MSAFVTVERKGGWSFVRWRYRNHEPFVSMVAPLSDSASDSALVRIGRRCGQQPGKQVQTWGLRPRCLDGIIRNGRSVWLPWGNVVVSNIICFWVVEETFDNHRKRLMHVYNQTPRPVSDEIELRRLNYGPKYPPSPSLERFVDKGGS